MIRVIRKDIVTVVLLTDSGWGGDLKGEFKGVSASILVRESGSESKGQKKSCAFFHEKEEVFFFSCLSKMLKTGVCFEFLRVENRDVVILLFLLGVNKIIKLKSWDVISTQNLYFCFIQ